MTPVIIARLIEHNARQAEILDQIRAEHQRQEGTNDPR